MFNDLISFHNSYIEKVQFANFAPQGDDLLARQLAHEELAVDKSSPAWQNLYERLVIKPEERETSSLTQKTYYTALRFLWQQCGMLEVKLAELKKPYLKIIQEKKECSKEAESLAESLVMSILCRKLPTRQVQTGVFMGGGRTVPVYSDVPILSWEESPLPFQAQMAFKSFDLYDQVAEKNAAYELSKFEKEKERELENFVSSLIENSILQNELLLSLDIIRKLIPSANALSLNHLKVGFSNSFSKALKDAIFKEELEKIAALKEFYTLFKELYETKREGSLYVSFEKTAASILQHLLIHHKLENHISKFRHVLSQEQMDSAANEIMHLHLRNKDIEEAKKVIEITGISPKGSLYSHFSSALEKNNVDFVRELIALNGGELPHTCLFREFSYAVRSNRLEMAKLIEKGISEDELRSILSKSTLSPEAKEYVRSLLPPSNCVIC